MVEDWRIGPRTNWSIKPTIIVAGKGGFGGGIKKGGKLIQNIINIPLYLIGLGLILFIILIPVSMIWQEKPLLKYYYSEITDPLLNTGFGNYIKKGLSALTIPFSEKKQAEVLESYSWKSTIDENSKKQDLGVKITSFRAIRDVIKTERFTKEFQITEAIAEGYASSTEPTEIKFSCLTEDNKLGEVANRNNILQISGSGKQFFSIKCIYPKGSFEINTNKATDSKTIRIRATYDFTTQSYIPIYLIRKDVFDELREKGSRGPVRFEYNIFEENNIQDEHLNEQDGIAESVYTKGPIKLELRSQYTQPYTEEGPFGSGSSYTLDIKIDDDISWTGNIEQINEFYLYIPEEIDLISDNFEYSAAEDNFNVYKAKDSLMQELNNVCKSKDKKIIDLMDEDCWRRGNIITSVEFSVNDAPDEISNTFIRARVNYKFNDEKQDTITFINAA